MHAPAVRGVGVGSEGMYARFFADAEGTRVVWEGELPPPNPDGSVTIRDMQGSQVVSYRMVTPDGRETALRQVDLNDQLSGADHVRWTVTS